MRQTLHILIISVALLCAHSNAAARPDAPAWLTDVAVAGMNQASPHGLRLEINIPAMQLTVFEHNQVVAQYEVAIGARKWPSPSMQGETIGRIEWNPSWYPPKSPWAAGETVAKPGPRNPLGAVKLPIARGILVHGTNKPHTVGTAASHGCFRMRHDDVVSLAWYLQERSSSKNDPALLNKYQSNRYRTRVVNLDYAVPVDIVYQTVQIFGGDLHIYPDVYRYGKKLEDEIVAALTRHGHNPDAITPALIADIKSKLGQGAVRIAMQDMGHDFQFAVAY